MTTNEDPTAAAIPEPSVAEAAGATETTATSGASSTAATERPNDHLRPRTGTIVWGVLVLAFCAACGGDVRAALPVACAVEMVHTYSLIHDDLPCMDNDDLRRGKPTNHVVYGECTATLAGDALQAEAFHTILSTELPADVRAECARLLAEAAGENGICGGQQLDMEGEGKVLTKEELMELLSGK